jgi:hypothetical protein
MKVDAFNEFMIKLETLVPSPSTRVLEIDMDLSTMNQDQWETLHIFFKKKQIPGIQLNETAVQLFSLNTWQSFFLTCQNSLVTKLVLYRLPIYEWDETLWLMFFSQMKLTNINTLNVEFSGLGKTSENCLARFLEGASTVLTHLTVQAEDFSNCTENGWSQEFLGYFLNQLSHESRIKSFTLINDEWVGYAEDNFWSIFIKGISEITVHHLGLELLGLNHTPEEILFKLFSNISQSVTSLSISHNILYRFSDAQWRAIFDGLTETAVNTLDISEHHPLNLTDSTWKIICDGLRKTQIKQLHYKPIQFTPKQQQDVQNILCENNKSIAEPLLILRCIPQKEPIEIQTESGAKRAVQKVI